MVTPPSEGSKTRRRIPALAAAAVLVTSAAILRVWAAHGDLWLDEIRSIGLVHSAASPSQIFTAIHSDNNHYLNSLWLYLWGFRGNWIGYRIPSVIAGVGTVVLAGMIGRRRSITDAFVAMILTGFSYVLVLYSSEARGYSTVVFFSFLCFLLLDSYLSTRRWPTALWFSLSAGLGLLSHLQFESFLLAAFVWAGFRLGSSGAGGTMRSLAACFAFPFLLSALLYVVDIRDLAVEGGTHPGLLNCYQAAFAWAWGRPSPLPDWALFGASAIMVVAGLLLLWRKKSAWILFFPGILVVMPLGLALVGGSEVFYVRYFLVAIAFFLLLLAGLLSSLIGTGGRAGRTLAAILMVGYLAANGRQLKELIKDGRGNNGATLHFILQNSAQRPVTIGGDQDFRVGTVVNYFNWTGAGNRSLRYVTDRHWPANGADWYICQREAFPAQPAPLPHFHDALGHAYSLVKIVPTTPLSGLIWYVYQRQSL